MQPADTAIPLISVVVPAYNYGHLLPRALDSVLPQLDERSELVVVDDGSTDDTPQVLDDYASRCPRLRAVRQANAGAAAARNHGVRLAQGEYVLLLDADDELLPGALSELLSIVAARPTVDFVLGAHCSVFADGTERLRRPSSLAGSIPQRLRRYLLEKRISISHGCTLFRRRLLSERPYAEQFRGGEDIPVFAYVLAHADATTTAVPLARIHKHADSLRHSVQRDATHARALAEEVFAKLPAACQPLRNRYEAQRFLSLFRAAALRKEKAQALACYREAFTRSPWQALRWSYLRKRLALMVRGG